MTTDQPKRGKRVQIYIPADLLERWDRLPRYERSAAVAKALRLLWGVKPVPESGSDYLQKRALDEGVK